MAKRYIVPGDIGAANAEHAHDPEDLGSGTPDIDQYLRGDGAWADFAAAVQAALTGGDAEPGDLKASARSTPSTGWALCDGSAVGRTDPTYADLFAAIGETYGVGDGSTTFNLPDFRGRTIIGAGTGSGLTARSRGDTGGAETHTLTKAQIPTHVHTSPHGLVVHNDLTAGGGREAINNASSTKTTGNGSADGLGGGSHNNMQPYGVANVFIKL